MKLSYLFLCVTLCSCGVAPQQEAVSKDDFFQDETCSFSFNLPSGVNFDAARVRKVKPEDETPYQLKTSFDWSFHDSISRRAEAMMYAMSVNCTSYLHELSLQKISEGDRDCAAIEAFKQSGVLSERSVCYHYRTDEYYTIVRLEELLKPAGFGLTASVALISQADSALVFIQSDNDQMSFLQDTVDQLLASVETNAPLTDD